MQSKQLFYIALLSLTIAGAWGVLQISKQADDSRQTQSVGQASQRAGEAHSRNFESSSNPYIKRNNHVSPSDNDAQFHFDSILALINNGQAVAASKAINERYSSLSSRQLELLKSALLSLALRSNNNDTVQAKQVLLATSKAFDELTVWKHLGDAAVSDNDWNTAYTAYLRASELENNPIDLDHLLLKLVAGSGHLRSSFEANNDLLSVKNLYQNLNDLHPNFQRFQYELAISHLKLGETESAKRLLQPLIYDLELGEVSKQALAQINSRAGRSLSEQRREPEPSEAITKNTNIRSSDILVPLISVGSSFIVDSTIERQSARLLLDTGASITSLSSQLIERLKLKPTGQSIRLSTANGVTNARIYRVKQLQLGSLVLRDMLVAEINLSNNRSFQGLLGTDALNQLQPQYSYLIDNQESALIFRKR
ncbi:MAG: clan AA aspartic protease [Arenicella sp.]|nr:clan AA aspartic protease [Arenicella sp.]